VYAYVCVHTNADILHLEDYDRMEQEQWHKREMKGSKKSYSFDVFKQLCLWQKTKTKQNPKLYTKTITISSKG